MSLIPTLREFAQFASLTFALASRHRRCEALQDLRLTDGHEPLREGPHTSCRCSAHEVRLVTWPEADR